MPNAYQSQETPTERSTKTITEEPRETVMGGPHSIFDKRQKSLIVVLVSAAATC